MPLQIASDILNGIVIAALICSTVIAGVYAIDLYRHRNDPE